MKKYEWAVVFGGGVIASVGTWLALDRDAYLTARTTASTFAQALLPSEHTNSRPDPHTTDSTENRANSFWNASTSNPSDIHQSIKLPSVRPDVKKFIFDKYSNPQERAAMVQFAQAQQYQLDIGGTREGALTGMRVVDQSLACAYAVFGSNHYNKNAKEVLAILLGNKDQFKRYAEVSKNLSGQIFNAPRYEKPCIL